MFEIPNPLFPEDISIQFLNEKAKIFWGGISLFNMRWSFTEIASEQTPI